MSSEGKRGRSYPAHEVPNVEPKVPESSPESKLDLTSRSNSMGRDEAICWPSGSSYKGVLRLSGGDAYWVELRPATASGREVWWLRLARKEVER